MNNSDFFLTIARFISRNNYFFSELWDIYSIVEKKIMNCEIKGCNYFFKLFYTVVETSFQTNQKCQKI